MTMRLLTKLIDHLRVKRPNSGTWQEWEEWEVKARAEQPIRYFLFDTLVTQLKVWHRKYVMEPADWIRYRTYDKYHVIKPKTLEAGYHSPQERIMHATFGELVTYVEVSLGWRGWPYQLKKQPRKSKANLKKYGLEHLEWEIAEPTVPARQKQIAKEVKSLYIWWTEIRPNRISHNDKKLKDLEALGDDLSAVATSSIFRTLSNPATRNYYDCLNELDEFYDEQDHDMLAALFKILDYLD
jgi:hypothetical protein